MSRRHGYLHELGGDQPEASLLKALDDLAAQSSLDAIGLHGDEGAFHVHRLQTRHQRRRRRSTNMRDIIVPPRGRGHISVCISTNQESGFLRSKLPGRCRLRRPSAERRHRLVNLDKASNAVLILPPADGGIGWEQVVLSPSEIRVQGRGSRSRSADGPRGRSAGPFGPRLRR